MQWPSVLMVEYNSFVLFFCCYYCGSEVGWLRRYLL